MIRYSDPESKALTIFEKSKCNKALKWIVTKYQSNKLMTSWSHKRDHLRPGVLASPRACLHSLGHGMMLSMLCELRLVLGPPGDTCHILSHLVTSVSCSDMDTFGQSLEWIVWPHGHFTGRRLQLQDWQNMSTLIDKSDITFQDVQISAVHRLFCCSKTYSKANLFHLKAFLKNVPFVAVSSKLLVSCSVRTSANPQQNPFFSLQSGVVSSQQWPGLVGTVTRHSHRWAHRRLPASRLVQGKNYTSLLGKPKVSCKYSHQPNPFFPDGATWDTPRNSGRHAPLSSHQPQYLVLGRSCGGWLVDTHNSLGIDEI